MKTLTINRKIVWALLGSVVAASAAFAQTAGAPAAATAAPASAQPAKVQVDAAWVRTAVAGQQGTGGFMRLTARETMRLVGVSSPVAGVAEVHEMKMEGDVMKMRAVPGIDLPAGKTVELKPGGFHLMLMDLKQPLPRGSTVPLTLMLLDAKGAASQLMVTVPVSALAPAAADASRQ